MPNVKIMIIAYLITETHR